MGEIVHKVGDKVVAEVTNIESYGAFLKLEDGTIGLLHISEVSNQFIHNLKRYFHIGDKVEAQISEIDENTGRVKFSRKAIFAQEQRQIEKNKREKIKEEEISFEALEENLPKWIKEEKERIKK